MKDAPNHITMNMIGSAQTARKITEDSDVPIFLVVSITPKASREPCFPSVSHYTTSARSLIQPLYEPILSAIMQQWL